MGLLDTPAASLSDLLHRIFGHRDFRANQEEVCRAAVSGRDVLLVMPTGAGKSLCYQLPAIARGGTALVISPLIALMEDQASKLTQLGLRVARVHSGLSREESRQACREYLDGALQFLFIAPERLRVPGFAEMLARRKPSMVAIDEAHCISQWGHDFRPDYRMLGQQLPMLRPAAVIALTATATPRVQRDIAEQLNLNQAECFIHGFRRDNLAIEVVEISKPRRPALVCELLKDPARRPAIVYAPSRKEAESLANDLGTLFPAEAYHAGLEPARRDRVQRAFLNGELEAVVATIAFGMGIDKADVRTVIHTALPASLEAYYQEIGRAGRDGMLSRTVLLHSFADMRMHEFFTDRDYPPIADLDPIFKKLTRQPQPRESIRLSLQMPQDIFDKALDKLMTYGGAVLDYEGNATAGQQTWRNAYMAQASQRREQVALAVRYAASTECRMAALVRHFGDTADGERMCGQCDFCSPERAIAVQTRPATRAEKRIAHTLLRQLRSMSGRSLGRLWQELCPTGDLDRNQFEELAAAMARAGLLSLEDDAFEKDGRTISYRKASLTEYGESISQHSTLDLQLRGEPASEPRGRTTTRSSSPRPKPAPADPPALTAAQSALADRLRTWRATEAKKMGKPAFVIFSDRTLHLLASEQPVTIEDLLAIPGFGEAKATKFGEAICSICASM